MGYDQSQRRRVYDLAFRPYPGLVISVRKPGFDALDKLTSAVLVLGDDLSGRGLPGTEFITACRDLVDALAASLVGWNLTVDGRGVPATREGLGAQDTPFLLDVARTWYTVVVQAAEDGPEEPSRAPVADEPAPAAEDAHGELDDWLASLPTTAPPTTVPAAEE